MKRLNSGGDTIVEVLIAVAIASFAIGGAYTVVNKTLANSQQAQEHSEALKVAEGQLEQLKRQPPTLPGGTNVFCYNKDNSGQPILFTNALSVPATQAAYPDQCKGIGLAGYYGTAVHYDSKGTASPSDDRYIVYVRWDGATGGQDEVSLSYRVYTP